MTQPECTAAGHTWDTTTTPGTAVCKTSYTITNKLARVFATNVKVEVVEANTASATLVQNACVTVKAEQWAKLKVTIPADSTASPARTNDEVVCDNSDTNTDNNCGDAGNKDLIVIAKADHNQNEFKLEPGNAGANCVTLAVASGQ